MEAKTFFDHLRAQLLDKRQNLSSWRKSATPQEQQTRLGPADDSSVESHLRKLDAAIHRAEEGTLGVCQVCHEYVNARLLMMDYTACVCLDHFSPEERRQLEWELELSQVVQQALLPQHVPEITGLQLAAFSRPAQIVGGDYFDFFRFADDAFGVAIADVAGHGLSAGLLMATVQTALRTLAPLSQDPGDFVGHLNRFFCRNIHFTTFVTVFVGRFDTDRRALTYVNAGHNPPLVVHAQSNGESHTWLRPTAAAIGLAEDADFASDTIELDAGDLLLLYTDGVTEAANLHLQEFGADNLAQFAVQASRHSAHRLIDGLRERLLAFTDGQQLADDTTLVACKIV